MRYDAKKEYEKMMSQAYGNQEYTYTEEDYEDMGLDVMERTKMIKEREEERKDFSEKFREKHLIKKVVI